MSFYYAAAEAVHAIVENAAAKAMQESSTNPTEQAQQLARDAARLGFLGGVLAASVTLDGVEDTAAPEHILPAYKSMLMELRDGMTR